MKVLLPTTDTQTLKIIPMEYSTAVDVILTNEDTNASHTFENLTATPNAGYLDIPSTWSESSGSVSGVKCIAANNEYLSSPAGNYLGDTIDGLYIEIGFKLNSSEYAVLLFQTSNYNFDLFYLYTIANQLYISVTINGNSYSDVWEALLENNVLIITGSGNDLSVTVNDNLLGTLNIPESLSSFSSELFFNTFAYSTAIGDVTYNYIKINSHEWLAPNWTAPTTTNSQGVVTTLHSDVSTSAMIQSDITLTPLLINDTFYSFKVLDYTTKKRIYMGKIFVTNQTISAYSINDGKYLSKGKNNEFITY